MRVKYSQLKNLIEKTPEDIKRGMLKRVFSFEENFDTFCYFFFPDAVITTIPEFHYELYDFLFSDEDGAMAAPRGHAKSTLVGMMYIAWCIVNKTEKYIVYVSQSFQKTMQFIEPLAQEFKNNERLRYVYGDLTPRNTKGSDGKFRQDLIDIDGIRLQAASFEKNIRGFKFGNQRPTLIVLDDIEEDSRVLNPELRLKDSYKLDKVIIPSLDPISGKIKMIGTILHWDSLLVKKIRLYGGKIYKAIAEDGSILWPEYWSEERLLKKKKSIGSVAFSSEYLNNPIENEASLIKFEWIKDCFDEELSYNEDIKFDYKYLGCDFAFSDRVTADKSAYVGVGIGGDKHVITHSEVHKGMSITEQFDLLEKLFKEQKYTEVVMEENSIKGMSKELYTYDIDYYLIWTGANDPASKRVNDYREYDKKRHTVGKKAMILRLATQFENKNIALPYKTDEDKVKTNQMAEELMTYALSDGKLVEVGIHADIPIALAMALERANSDEVIIDF